MSDQNILQQLGFSDYFENQLSESYQEGLDIGRITSEHKDRYSLRTKDGIFEGEVIGNLRFTAQSRADFPVVGDWVLVSQYDEGKVLIQKIFARFNMLKRQAVGKDSDVQIIASNIDCALIIESGDRDFNINRYERYMTICYDAKIEPVLVLNKSDLLEEAELRKLKNQVYKRHPNIKLIISSCITNDGVNDINKVIESGKTYCLLGSSGVGKSTLINLISGEEILRTNEISDSIQRGKHTTTHRELVLLQQGGVLIDNPGMREVGIADASQGIEDTFYFIKTLAENCKYKDCTHQYEQGCAVRDALNQGKLDINSYQNYLKMEKENLHYQSSEKERRQKGKQLAKRIKHYKKRDVK